jgi:hypothetical protein
MRGAKEYPADLLLAGLAEIARAGFPLAAVRSSTVGDAWASGLRFAFVADWGSDAGSVSKPSGADRSPSIYKPDEYTDQRAALADRCWFD